jgi:predicted AlkP superfamily pyrophosphatase or phosphodiesterase
MRLFRIVSALGMWAALFLATPVVAGHAGPPKFPEYVVLFVLEGFGRDSLKTGAMPVVSRLVSQGSVTWSAVAVKPPLRLPTMASLLTGLPVEKHGVDWDSFDFARGYPRPPMIFDYLDLAGGKDTAVFFMDESLYQLARPAAFVDYQVCGRLRPECRAATVVGYIRDYFRKGDQGGYNHYVFTLPHLLVVHLPDAARAGQEHGWTSKAYVKGLNEVDGAIGAVLDLYRSRQLLDQTMIIVTALSGVGEPKSDGSLPHVPWIASGANIKAGHTIAAPVSILDTGATILRALGLNTHTEWQSRAIEEIFREPRGVVHN